MNIENQEYHFHFYMKYHYKAINTTWKDLIIYERKKKWLGWNANCQINMI